MTGQAFLLTFGFLRCFIFPFKVQNPCSDGCFNNMMNYSYSHLIINLSLQPDERERKVHGQQKM